MTDEAKIVEDMARAYCEAALPRGKTYTLAAYIQPMQAAYAASGHKELLEENKRLIEFITTHSKLTVSNEYERGWINASRCILEYNKGIDLSPFLAKAALSQEGT